MVNEYGSGGSYSVQMEGPFAIGGGSGGARMTELHAPVANWKGGESPYSQIVALENISTNSKVSIQLSADQLELFFDQTIAFTTCNEDGVVTLFAIGDKPKADCVFQTTIEEVVLV
jgi:hypothetical protein